MARARCGVPEGVWQAYPAPPVPGNSEPAALTSFLSSRLAELQEHRAVEASTFLTRWLEELDHSRPPAGGAAQPQPQQPGAPPSGEGPQEPAPSRHKARFPVAAPPPQRRRETAAGPGGDEDEQRRGQGRRRTAVARQRLKGLLREEGDGADDEDVLWAPPSSADAAPEWSSGRVAATKRAEAAGAEFLDNLRRMRGGDVKKDDLPRRLNLEGKSMDLAKSLVFHHEANLLTSRLAELVERYEKQTLTRRYQRVVAELNTAPASLRPVEELLELMINNKFDDMHVTLGSVLKAARGHNLERQELAISEQEADAMLARSEDAKKGHDRIYEEHQQALDDAIVVLQDAVARAHAEIRRCAERLQADAQERQVLAKARADFEQEMYDLNRRDKYLVTAIQEIEDKRVERLRLQAERTENLRQELVVLRRARASLEKQVDDTRQRCQDLALKIEQKIKSKMLANIQQVLEHHQRRKLEEHELRLKTAQRRRAGLTEEVQRLKTLLLQRTQTLEELRQVRRMVELRLHVLEARGVHLQMKLRLREIIADREVTVKDAEAVDVAALAPEVSEGEQVEPLPGGLLQVLAGEMERQREWLTKRGQPWEFHKGSLVVTRRPPLSTPASLIKAVWRGIKRLDIARVVIAEMQMARHRKRRKSNTYVIEAVKAFKRLLKGAHHAPTIDEDSMKMRCTISLGRVLLKEHVDYGPGAAPDALTPPGGRESLHLRLQALAELPLIRGAVEGMMQKWEGWQTDEVFKATMVLADFPKAMGSHLADLLEGFELASACGHWFTDGLPISGAFTDLLAAEDFDWLPQLATGAAERCGVLRGCMQLLEEEASAPRGDLVAAAHIVSDCVSELKPILDNTAREKGQRWLLRVQQGLRKKADLLVAAGQGLFWYCRHLDAGPLELAHVHTGLDALGCLLTAPQLHDCGALTKATQPELDGLIQWGLRRALKEDGEAMQLGILALAALSGAFGGETQLLPMVLNEEDKGKVPPPVTEHVLPPILPGAPAPSPVAVADGSAAEEGSNGQRRLAQPAHPGDGEAAAPATGAAGPDHLVVPPAPAAAPKPASPPDGGGSATSGSSTPSSPPSTPPPVRPVPSPRTSVVPSGASAHHPPSRGGSPTAVEPAGGSGPPHSAAAAPGYGRHRKSLQITDPHALQALAQLHYGGPGPIHGQSGDPLAVGGSGIPGHAPPSLPPRALAHRASLPAVPPMAIPELPGHLAAIGHGQPGRTSFAGTQAGRPGHLSPPDIFPGRHGGGAAWEALVHAEALQEAHHTGRPVGGAPRGRRHSHSVISLRPPGVEGWAELARSSVSPALSPGAALRGSPFPDGELSALGAALLPARQSIRPRKHPHPLADGAHSHGGSPSDAHEPTTDSSSSSGTESEEPLTPVAADQLPAVTRAILSAVLEAVFIRRHGLDQLVQPVVDAYVAAHPDNQFRLGMAILKRARLRVTVQRAKVKLLRCRRQRGKDRRSSAMLSPEPRRGSSPTRVRKQMLELQAKEKRFGELGRSDEEAAATLQRRRSVVAPLRPAGHLVAKSPVPGDYAGGALDVEGHQASVAGKISPAGIYKRRQSISGPPPKELLKSRTLTLGLGDEGDDEGNLAEYGSRRRSSGGKGPMSPPTPGRDRRQSVATPGSPLSPRSQGRVADSAEGRRSAKWHPGLYEEAGVPWGEGAERRRSAKWLAAVDGKQAAEAPPAELVVTPELVQAALAAAVTSGKWVQLNSASEGESEAEAAGRLPGAARKEPGHASSVAEARIAGWVKALAKLDPDPATGPPRRTLVRGSLSDSAAAVGLRAGQPHPQPRQHPQPRPQPNSGGGREQPQQAAADGGPGPHQLQQQLAPQPRGGQQQQQQQAAGGGRQALPRGADKVRPGQGQQGRQQELEELHIGLGRKRQPKDLQENPSAGTLYAVLEGRLLDITGRKNAVRLAYELHDPRWRETSPARRRPGTPEEGMASPPGQASTATLLDERHAHGVGANAHPPRKSLPFLEAESGGATSMALRAALQRLGQPANFHFDPPRSTLLLQAASYLRAEEEEDDDAAESDDGAAGGGRQRRAAAVAGRKAPSNRLAAELSIVQESQGRKLALLPGWTAVKVEPAVPAGVDLERRADAEVALASGFALEAEAGLLGLASRPKWPASLRDEHWGACLAAMAASEDLPMGADLPPLLAPKPVLMLPELGGPPKTKPRAATAGPAATARASPAVGSRAARPRAAAADPGPATAREARSGSTTSWLPAAGRPQAIPPPSALASGQTGPMGVEVALVLPASGGAGAAAAGRVHGSPAAIVRCLGPAVSERSASPGSPSSPGSVLKSCPGPERMDTPGGTSPSSHGRSGGATSRARLVPGVGRSGRTAR